MNILPTILMASALVSPLTTGKPLPHLKGEFLTGRQAQLPDAASGRVALLALGFTYDSRFPVEAWIGRFRKDFGNNPQVTFYEIPMIGGMARMGKWFIDSGMRKGTPRKRSGKCHHRLRRHRFLETARGLRVAGRSLSDSAGQARRGALAPQRRVRRRRLQGSLCPRVCFAS